MCGAPIVYGMMINAPAALKEGIEHQVNGLIAGAAPPAAIIEGASAWASTSPTFTALTENLRPGRRLRPSGRWDCRLHRFCRPARNGRQGVRYHMQEAITVLDPVSLEPVPWDGETMDEIMFRGNLVMKGYPEREGDRGPSPTAGFHTGDLAVVHSDYVKIKDRSRT